MGNLELVARGRAIRLWLSDGLVWGGDDPGYVRLVSTVCPASSVEDGGVFMDGQQKARLLLYAAAQRLGARVVWKADGAVALA